MVRTVRRASLALLAWAAFAASALADDAKGEGPHVRVELLAERPAVVPGKDLVLGVRFTTDEHWHVYWKHEGDSGLPPTVNLTLHFPQPFLEPDMTTFPGTLRWARRAHVQGLFSALRSYKEEMCAEATGRCGARNV